jgi:hypothetical protein
MSKYSSWCVYALLVSGLFVRIDVARGQQWVPIPEVSGQDVVPVYEGWERNPDGTFDMFFGYMNRNYSEDLNIPIGQDNNMQPDGPDRGQPTYFYPRRDQFVFRVRVPKDWGEKDLVWTLNSHGRTEKAYGTLAPSWEIDERLIVKNMGGTQRLDEVDNDQPPTVKVDPVPPVTLPNTAKLTAYVTDDGLPKPIARRPTASTRQPSGGDGGGPIANAPPVTARVRLRPPQGLSVMWVQYRGPGKVTFDPPDYEVVVGGKVTATATFSEPGTYVLRAIASDSIEQTTENVTVTVAAPASRP